MSPKTRTPEQRAEAILNAAHRLFAEFGLENTRLEDVARHAQVSKGSLYQIAESKLDLFSLVWQRQIGRDNERFEKALAENDDPEKALMATVLASLPDRREPPGTYAMIFELAAMSLREPILGEKMRHDFSQRHDRFIEQVGTKIRQGMATGRFRADLDSDTIALSLYSYIHFSWLRWVGDTEQSPATLLEAAQQYVDSVLQMLKAVDR